MAQVPNTSTFELQDVVDVVNPTTDDLVDCFADADNELFDPNYKEDETTLLEFRNYDGNLQGLLYLIHPDNVSSGSTHAWSANDNTFIGTTDISIGSGNSNSIDIAADDDGDSAADRCLSLSSNGYGDWFLPSRDTLSQLLYPVRALVNTGISSRFGDTLTSNDYYWSSSENDATTAHAVQVGSGNYITLVKDNSTLAYKKSRAIRIQENVNVNDYDIGDYAFGGIVFKKYRYGGVPGWILVMYKDELSTSVWSNVDVNLYPLVDSSFGEIETAAIIAQSGHTTSAAKLCNDLVAEGYSDWFLPANLGKWGSRLTDINNGLESVGGDTVSTSDQIWSSRQTQTDSTKGRMLPISSALSDEDKQNTNKVRAVRKVFVDDLNAIQYGDFRDGGVVVYKSLNDPSQEDARVLGKVYTPGNSTEVDYYFSERDANSAVYLMPGMKLYTNARLATTLSAGTYLQDGLPSRAHVNYFETDTTTIVVGSGGVISSISGRKLRATDGFDYYGTDGTTVIYRDTFYYDDSIGDASNLSVGDVLHRSRNLSFPVLPSNFSDGRWEQNGVAYTDINEICTSSSSVGRFYVGPNGEGKITSISCV